ncbi:DUF2141 domain-containing protein [Hyphococcus sp.]|uniref:DUF2141 domain-containing protein n=1 Tax=Hyphococcus sp. TaxID=2038636 RepID=UPI0035C699F5
MFDEVAKVKRIGIIVSILLASAAAPSFAKKAELSDADFAFEHVSCTGAENEIRVIVSGVKKSVGLVTVDLFPNREEGFLRGRGRIDQVKFAAKAPFTKLCLHAPESGLFALSAYHDENANGDFDKTGLGLPAEPWGISNNPKVRFAPPPVEKALFNVAAENGAHVNIDLN